MLFFVNIEHWDAGVRNNPLAVSAEFQFQHSYHRRSYPAFNVHPEAILGNVRIAGVFIARVNSGSLDESINTATIFLFTSMLLARPCFLGLEELVGFFLLV